MLIRRLTLGLAGLCAVGLCLGAAPLPWAAAPGAFRLHLAALALALAPALVLLGARRAGFGVAGIAALAIGSVAPGFSPARAALTSGPGTEVTLVSANLRRTNTQPEAMLRDLLALDADILALQEIPPGFLTDRPALRRAYPHGVAHASPVPAGGRAVLSRLPLATGGAGPRRGDQPGHAAVDIDVGGATLRVMSVHFDWPLIGAQAMQADRFTRFAKDFAPGGHAVLAGDFNAPPWSQVAARAGAAAGTAPAGGVMGTWRGVAPGALPGVLRTWAFGAPLDHVQLSPGIGLVALRAAPIAGSDHLALRATLFVPAP